MSQDQTNPFMELISNVPIPTAGLALGLAALGNLLQPFSGVVRGLCGVMALVLISMLVAKLILFPRSIKADFENPILASVSATFFMAMMQLSSYVAPYAAIPAFALWCTVVVAHLALMVWFGVRFIRQFNLEQVFPTWFICYVGIIVAAVTSPVYGAEALGQVFFWIGFASYIPLIGIITYRYIKHPVPHAARPLFCIYSAPASLSIAGYLAVTDQPNLIFSVVLLAIAQLLFIMVLFQLPKFLKGGFYPSYAAMTFPFVITATAFTLMLDVLSEAGYAIPMLFEVVVGIETLFATFMVVFVFARYMAFFAKPFIEKRKAQDPSLACE